MGFVGVGRDGVVVGWLVDIIVWAFGCCKDSWWIVTTSLSKEISKLLAFRRQENIVGFWGKRGNRMYSTCSGDEDEVDRCLLGLCGLLSI